MEIVRDNANMRLVATLKISKRWVVKAGSNMVVSGGPMLIRSWMQQVAVLRKTHGIEVIWVTSGAIASAVLRTGFQKGGNLAKKQALSAIGQPLIIDLYNLGLQTSGLLGAQVLLTYDDLENAQRRSNLQNTLKQLLKWGVTPVLNENDAVATEEIRFGDNDSLSAKVAQVMDADRLVILTDVEGLFDSNPKKNPRAKLIPSLTRIEPKRLSQMDRAAGSDRGTGGMFSKLLAADLASRAGIETWLVKGDAPSVLVDIAGNRKIGTRIGARK
jgi:glutamate 5-kinase